LQTQLKAIAIRSCRLAKYPKEPSALHFAITHAQSNPILNPTQNLAKNMNALKMGEVSDPANKRLKAHMIH
jgi:hypothetical protein